MAEPNVFLTSDTHFGRTKIIELSNREFLSSEQMDKKMIELWNEAVGKEDVVYHLGNFAWDAITARSVLDQLNGKIYFLEGNYDKALSEVIIGHHNANFLARDILELSKYNAVLCHYPLHEWNGKEDGVLHFHGHMLKDLPTDLDKMNRINVCIDNWSLQPLNISTMMDIIEDYKKLKNE